MAGWGLTEKALMERAPGASTWGVTRARRGPRVAPTTLAEQDRQIRAPPPPAPGLRCHPLLKHFPLWAPRGRTESKIDCVRGKRSDLTPVLWAQSGLKYRYISCILYLSLFLLLFFMTLKCSLGSYLRLVLYSTSTIRVDSRAKLRVMALKKLVVY